MRYIFSLVIIMALSGAPAALFAQNEKKEDQSLDALADDLKFRNGVEFITLKMYDKALENFREYLEIYYNGTHRDEAYRHIAEIYFRKLDYLKAVDNYRSLYEEFSTTESGIEAYFNMAICYNKMGGSYDKKAAEIFNDIIENHPDSAFAQQSRLQMDILNIMNDRQDK